MKAGEHRQRAAENPVFGRPYVQQEGILLKERAVGILAGYLIPAGRADRGRAPLNGGTGARDRNGQSSAEEIEQRCAQLTLIMG